MDKSTEGAKSAKPAPMPLVLRIAIFRLAASVVICLGGFLCFVYFVVVGDAMNGILAAGLAMVLASAVGGPVLAKAEKARRVR